MGREGIREVTFVGPAHAYCEARPDNTINDGAGQHIEGPLRIVARIALHQVVVRVVPAVCAQPQPVFAVVPDLEAANVLCMCAQALSCWLISFALSHNL